MGKLITVIYNLNRSINRLRNYLNYCIHKSLILNLQSVFIIYCSQLTLKLYAEHMNTESIYI